MVEYGYIENGATHYELNLVFEVAIAGTEPTSQEDHLEFHWLPINQLAQTDIRPGTLKTALLAAGDDRTPVLARLERLSPDNVDMFFVRPSGAGGRRATAT